MADDFGNIGEGFGSVAEMLQSCFIFNCLSNKSLFKVLIVKVEI